MFIELYNFLRFAFFAIISFIILVCAIIITPSIIRFIILKIINIKSKIGCLKQNSKQKDINFDEFGDIEEIREQEEKNKQQMQYEYEVLKQAYEEAFDDDYKVEYSEIIEAGKNLDDVKKDLYNFKILDSINISDNKKPEGAFVQAIKENGNSIDIELFKNWSMQIFKCIKMGSKEELNIVKNVINHQLYNKFIQQILRFEKDGLEFITEDLMIKQISLFDYSKAMDKEEIKILIKAKMKEYIIDKTSNKVIKGNRKKSYEKKIIMTFLKQNLDEKEGFINNCPSCGAETSQVEFGQCKYCNTLVFPIRYNWTLIKFETI